MTDKKPNASREDGTVHRPAGKADISDPLGSTDALSEIRRYQSRADNSRNFTSGFSQHQTEQYGTNSDGYRSRPDQPVNRPTSAPVTVAAPSPAARGSITITDGVSRGAMEAAERREQMIAKLPKVHDVDPKVAGDILKSLTGDPIYKKQKTGYDVGYGPITALRAEEMPWSGQHAPSLKAMHTLRPDAPPAEVTAHRQALAEDIRLVVAKGKIGLTREQTNRLAAAIEDTSRAVYHPQTAHITKVAPQADTHVEKPASAAPHADTHAAKPASAKQVSYAAFAKSQVGSFSIPAMAATAAAGALIAGAAQAAQSPDGQRFVEGAKAAAKAAAEGALPGVTETDMCKRVGKATGAVGATAGAIVLGGAGAAGGLVGSPVGSAALGAAGVAAGGTLGNEIGEKLGEGACNMARNAFKGKASTVQAAEASAVQTKEAATSPKTPNHGTAASRG